MKQTARVFYQEDCDLSLLYGKTIAVIGYGSQGHAHALNAKESLGDKARVIIGLYEGSKSWAKAEKQGFEVFTTAEAAKQADIIMILINDEKQAAMYKKDIEPNLKSGDMLMFAHGFNIHFGCIKPPADIDVTMIVRNIRLARVLRAWLLLNRMQLARLWIWLWLMVWQSAVQELVFWKLHSGQKLKPTCSVNRLFSAAVFVL